VTVKRDVAWVLLVAVAVATATPAAGAPAAADSTTAVNDTLRSPLRAPRARNAAAVDDDALERARLKETLQRMGRREVEGRRRWERRKSGKVAMLSSALLPGLGQVYNGRRMKAAVMVGITSAYLAQVWLNHKAGQRALSERDRLTPGTSAFNFQNRLSEFREDEARIWVWWTGAVWLIGILDAWTDAHLYDIRAYTPPSDEEPGGVSSELPTKPRMSYLTLTFGF
jgi:hypothetical protein